MVILKSFNDNMKCQRCKKNEGEYLCSVCNRVVCEDCKVVDNKKIYCLGHSPIQIPKKEPIILKIFKELIYSVLILLIGIIIIFVISNYFIAGLLSSIAEQVSDVFPALDFIFVLLTYFETAGLYAIITLLIILIILIIAYKIKKSRYKNI